MIQSTVRLQILERQQAEVLRTLRILTGHATARAGCAYFSVSREAADPTTVTITERWATRKDLDEHVRSTEYRLLLTVIDLSVTPPDIRFDVLDHIGGLDLVQSLRAPPQFQPET